MGGPSPATDERLRSWKEIAAYLGREARTVQRWEREEGLPVHRHIHKKRGTIYAYRSEIDAWWQNRRAALELTEKAHIARWPRRWLNWKTALLAAGVLLIGGALWLRWFFPKAGVQEVESSPVPLTTYPGDETWPAFSPDSSQVVFGWKGENADNWDIYVKVVGSGPPFRLTTSPDWDIGPAWSPDGRRIAFYRRSQDRAAIYVVSPLGGPEGLLAELSSGPTVPPYPLLRHPNARLAWSPDGSLIAFSGRERPAEPYSVFLLAADTGAKRRLTSPPSGWVGDRTPVFSPDGQTVAFSREEVAPRCDLWAVSVRGGEPRRLTFVDAAIAGLAWIADGHGIVFSSARGGEGGLWKISASGGAPKRVRGTGPGAVFPAISRRGNRLVYAQMVSDTNIWRAETSGAPHGLGSLTKLIASTRNDHTPQYSPDGKRIAFSSDRSGSMQVWVCDSDGANAVQLTSFSEPGAELPRWSPDGQHIAFNSDLKGNWDIYTMRAEGGAARQLTSDPATDAAASWSNDGRWVYFASNRGGTHQLWRVPAEGGAQVQVTRNGGWRSHVSPDSRFVYYTKAPDNDDAWRVPVDGGDEVPILKGLQGRWAVVGNGIYFYGPERGQWFIKFFNFKTGRTMPVVALEGDPILGQPPAVSPDGRSFLYGREDLRGSDLMLVENFR